jgi:hypothetical protein
MKKRHIFYFQPLMVMPICVKYSTARTNCFMNGVLITLDIVGIILEHSKRVNTRVDNSYRFNLLISVRFSCTNLAYSIYIVSNVDTS